MIANLVASFPPGQGGLSPSQVDNLIGAFDTVKMSQGRIGTPGKRTVNNAVRSGQVQWIGADEVGDQIFSHLFTLGVVANRERKWDFELRGITRFLQGTCYDAGRQEHYSWHMDWGVGGNQRRKIGIVAHLSEQSTFEGGSLQLANGSVPVEANQVAGTVTVFPGFLMHRVTPVTKGTRLGMVAWILGPPFR